MDPSQMFNHLKAQRQLLEAAKARKGQRAANKPSRQELLWRFEQHSASSFLKTGTREHTIRTCQILHAYPPCTKPLSELKPITISELRLETNHVGRVLFVRTICQPMRMQAVQAIVEDKNSDVDQLAIYNSDQNASPENTLPKDAVFAIKDPYFKTSASGSYLIRADHPSDVIRLPPTHPMVPIELMPRLLELDKDALSFKTTGNKAFKEKKYRAALEAYSEGINACAADDRLLQRDLYRNRALVNTYLSQFDAAYADALAAIIPDADGDDTATKNNVKALYRAGRAAYCLENFSQAKMQFEELLKIAPGDKDGQEQLKKTGARIQEITTGEYDFEAMGNLVSLGHKRLDHASFTSNVVIRKSAKKGNGLFATKDVKSGAIILVEKAFSVAHQSELGKEMHMILNLNTNTGRIGPHATLFYQLVQKARHNSGPAKTLLRLFDGEYSPKCIAPVVDGKIVIDTFQVAAIMEHNCFGCPDKRTADDVGKSKRNIQKRDEESKSVGVWKTASYMNHACDAKANRSFMGDIMIVRATKDIKKDQEISIPYRAPDFDIDSTQEALQKNWKFKCDCTMCTAEATTPAAQRKERKAVIKEVDTFLKKHPKPVDYATRKSVIAQAEKLYIKLDATYDKKVFSNIPRIVLANLGHWICGVHATDITIHKVTDCANRVLEDLGYRVTVNGYKLHIDRTHGCAQMVGMDAAMYAAHACYLLKKVELGKQYEEFARERYLIFYGEMKGFAERYGDSEKMI